MTEQLTAGRETEAQGAAQARAGARWLLPTLLGLFFLSGSTGLIYQVLWLRLLALVFGVTVWAASTVLAAFMAGLALGSLAAGRLVDRARVPLVWYGVAEILVGLSALATPAALKLLEQAYVGLYPALADTPGPLTALRFVLSFSVLLVPTTLMGATLPIVIKSSLLRGEGLGQRASVLYATNTAGAVAGTLLAGFYLVGSIGVQTAFLLAAGLNVAVGLAAIAASRVLTPGSDPAPDARYPARLVPRPAGATTPHSAPDTRHPAPDTQPPTPSRQPSASGLLPLSTRRLVLVVFFVSGFATLAMEVIWFRVLVLYLVATTYAFTVMLATVLCGIAIGSYLVAPLMRRQVNWLVLLAGLEIAIGISAVFSLAALPLTYDLLAWLNTLLGGQAPLLSGQTAPAAIASFAALFPATLLMGVAFPVGLRLWASEREGTARAGERVGVFYSLNVVGAILGSVVAGFVLLPWLGSQTSLVAVACLSLLAGLALLGAQFRVSGLWSLDSGLWSLVSGLWSPFSGLWSPVSRSQAKLLTTHQRPETRHQRPETRHLRPETRHLRLETRDQRPETRDPRPRTRDYALGVAGLLLFGAAVAAVPDPFANAVERRHPGERLVWHEEGVQTTVTVHERQDGVRVLYLNGLHQANDEPTMVAIHRMIGHLPMALHPDPREALVIGLGGGATPGAVSQYPGVQVEVVELSGTVVRGAEWFRHVNYDVLEQPNVQLLVDDGRNYLLLSQKRYDVITADIIQPMHAGAGNLYSREYFELARNALKDDGIMLQWLGWYPETQHKLIMRTFLSVFPDTTLWFNGILMVGTQGPLELDPADFERRLQDPATREVLASMGLSSFDALLGQYWAGPEELQDYVGRGPILTDDRPMVEYFLSLPRGEREADLSEVRGDARRHVLRMN